MLPVTRTRLSTLLVFVAVFAAGCAPAAAPAMATVAPTPLDTASPSAATSTSAPTSAPSMAPVTVTVDTPDGASLTAQQYGAGEVAVIFSPMGDCVGDWAALAEGAEAEGLMALTYQWRACEPGGVDNSLIRKFVDDLRGVIDYAHAQGAQRVILVGASLGGLASARLLSEEDAVGLVVVAAPDSIPDWNVQVEASHLASDAPKLFITAEADTVVAASATRALHDLAADPSEWQTYPGTAHGTHLFATESGAAAQARILDFILDAAAAPAPPATATNPPSFFTVSSGPVVREGAPGAWDYPFTDPGAVVFHDGQFHMLRNGFKAWPASVQIGYVTSPDGLVWSKQGDEPVFTTAEVPYAGLAMLASSVLVEPDGTWVLYFYTWPGVNSTVGGGIGRATAAQPAGPWTPDPELVLAPGPVGAWDGNQVLSPHVLRTDDRYLMYYSGNAGTGREQIGRATSTDGVAWIKYDDPATTDSAFAASDPVLMPGPASAWDSTLVHQPRVFQTDTGWAMLYRGLLRNTPVEIGLGLALSPDGLHWERSPLNPVLKPSAIPGRTHFWFTSALQHDDTTYLFWEVGRANITEIWAATHAGPLE